MFFIKAILMSMLPFYRIDFPVNSLPKEFTYTEYKQGRELGHRIIKEDEEIYRVLKRLLFEDKKGWRYDLVTYVPNRTFNSLKMKINCFDNALIVNYEEANHWIQISKTKIKSSCPIVDL